MKKLFLIMAIIWGISGLVYAGDIQKEVIINESHAGKTITLQPGQSLSVLLSENPSTGYQWTTKNYQPSIIELSDSTFKAGSSGTRIFNFVVKHVGETDLVLVLERSWEENVPPTKTFSVKVVVAFNSGLADFDPKKAELKSITYIEPDGQSQNGLIHIPGYGWVGMYPKTTPYGSTLITFRGDTLYVKQGNNWVGIAKVDQSKPEYGGWDPDASIQNINSPKNSVSKSSGDHMIVNGKIHLPGWGWIGVFPNTTKVPRYGEVSYIDGELRMKRDGSWVPLADDKPDYGDWHPSF